MTGRRFALHLTWTLALALSGAACSVAPRNEASPPTLDELQRVTYDGSGDLPGAATLVDDFFVVGDLDGDGAAEAVVLLVRSPAGTGSWSALTVVKRIGGRLSPIASTALGDRVQVRAVRIEGGRLLASGVRAGRSTRRAAQANSSNGRGPCATGGLSRSRAA